PLAINDACSHMIVAEAPDHVPKVQGLIHQFHVPFTGNRSFFFYEPEGWNWGRPLSSKVLLGIDAQGRNPTPQKHANYGLLSQHHQPRYPHPYPQFRRMTVLNGVKTTTRSRVASLPNAPGGGTGSVEFGQAGNGSTSEELSDCAPPIDCGLAGLKAQLKASTRTEAENRVGPVFGDPAATGHQPQAETAGALSADFHGSNLRLGCP